MTDHGRETRDHATLRSSRDAGGSRHLEATRSADGGIRIEGQDIGPGVSAAFGPDVREYEWAWTVEPADVAAAVAVLGGGPGEDVVRLLLGWSTANHGADPGQRLKEAGVRIGFWSRVGD